jgi:succinyl-CoA synthetase beta subunit
LSGGKLVAADAKLGFDDNAAFRQEELFAMRDESQEDPRRAAARLCAPTLRAAAARSRRGARAGC